MKQTLFKVNLRSEVAWTSRHPLLETDVIPRKKQFG